MLIIGGSGRGSGKTALACSLIAAIPEIRWAAVKITPHAHSLSIRAFEETDLQSEKDTGRYLRAGAKRAFLVPSALPESILSLLQEVRAIAVECDGLLIESNQVHAEVLAHRGEPIVTLAAVAENSGDTKQSLMAHLDKAEAVIFSRSIPSGAFASLRLARPVFYEFQGECAEPGLITFVRERILAH